MEDLSSRIYLLYSQNGSSKKLEGEDLELVREFLSGGEMKKHTNPRGKYNYFYEFEGDAGYIEDIYVNPEEEKNFYPNGNVVPLCESYVDMVLSHLKHEKR